MFPRSTPASQPPSPSGLAPKFFGYILTGGSAAVVDVGLFWLLLPRLGSVAACATLSFLCAAAWNYASSSRLVFREPLSWDRALRFLAAAIVGLAVNVGVTWTYTAVFGGAPVHGKLVGIGVAFLLNFALNVTLVFRGGRRG